MPERPCGRAVDRCYRRGVLPEDIRKLRKELSCTARELAVTLGVDAARVAAWESGDEFPTKRYVEAMEALRQKGPTAIVRQPKGKATAKSGVARLSDPSFWRVVRKLVEHPALFDQVAKLSEKYPDPVDSP